MEKKFLGYSIREFLVLLAGTILLAIQIKRYAYDQLSQNLVIEAVALMAAILMIMAPRSLVSIFKKRLDGADDK